MRRVLLCLAGALLLVPGASAAGQTSRPVALVTAETSNEVVAVSLGPHGGRILRRVHVHDPLTIAATCDAAIAVSPTGTVTLLEPRSLRRLATLRSFRSPQIATFVAGSGDLAYVTDARTGELSVIDFAQRRVIDRVFVGGGAHHLALSPDSGLLWVALGENASTIVRLDISRPRRPRVIGRFHPAVTSHDLAFAPGGRTVWVTSATAPVVSVYAATDGRLLRKVPAGKAPQHLAFDRGRVLIASGYGSSLEAVSQTTHRRIRLVPSAYGSFNLATYGDLVVTTSLLDGKVSEYRLGDLRRLWTTKVAPAARAVAISACTNDA
jgi:hypothetical protein